MAAVCHETRRDCITFYSLWVLRFVIVDGYGLAGKMNGLTISLKLVFCALECFVLRLETQNLNSMYRL